jgi:hypothetical protein
MESGDWINYNGGRSWVWFTGGGTGTNEQLRIEEAYIAETTNTMGMTPDIIPSTIKRLVHWPSRAASYTLTGSSGAWFYHDLATYPIDKSKTYAVTYRVHHGNGKGHARYWEEEWDAAGRGCYILSAATPGDTIAPIWSSKTNLVVSDRLYGVQYLYTSYPTNGLYTSRIFDTHKSAPAYSTMSWDSVMPHGTLLRMKVRSGANSDLSDATAWTNLTWMTMPGSISPGDQRYVQFRAELRPDSGGWQTPKLKDVTIRWPGDETLVNISGTLTKGPDYGIYELTVDGQELKTGLNVDLEIFKDVRGFKGTRRVTSELTAEVVPRNTGR